MSRPFVLGLTLLSGALVLLVLWSTPEGRGGIAGLDPEGRQQQTVARSASTGLLSVEEPDQEFAQTTSSHSESGIEHEPTWAPQRVEAPDERPRISGTVRVRSGIPTGEAVQVRAEVFPKSGNGSHSLVTRVANDGSFTLTVPEDTNYAKLDLESRFLVLSGAVKARPGETGVELTPLAYATIAGQVVLPLAPSTPGGPWSDTEVSWASVLRPDRSSEQMLDAMLSPSRDRPVQPDPEGAFVLTFVPVGVELELHAENPFGPEWSQRIPPLEPAEQRRVVIELELGITVTGCVLDEHGQPVEALAISTGGRELDLRRPASPTHLAKTDTEGRFVLERMPRRATTIFTSGLDLIRNAETTVDGTDGDVRGIVLSVVRGGCIEGTVVWTDHSPVDVFSVSAIGEGGVRRETGQAGRFRLPALGPGSYRVDVRAKSDRAVGTASALAVQAGAAPLRLVLAEVRAFAARGLVVDREGAPVERFSVSARGPAPEHRRESADGYDGRLLLIGLAPGEWSFEVRARGHQVAYQQAVMAEGTAPLRFELGPAGRLRGRVVDAAGAPVPGAWVGEERKAMPAAVLVRGGGADAEGRFDIEANSPSLRLLAQKRGYAPSSVVELALEPGESIADLVLQLRESCRVEGRVLGAHGEPVPGATVFVPSSVLPGAETDSQGSFVLEGLPPGSVGLHASHPSLEGALASAMVTLAPGRPCSVELRFEELLR